MTGGSTLEQFDESHHSWRSAAHNQKNPYSRYAPQQHLDENDHSRLYKDADDTTSFLEPNDNTSVSASASANYANINNQSSYSNLGKPPSSSFSKNLQSMKEAYQSKIQALTQKVEDEKNRQRQRSKNRHQLNPGHDKKRADDADDASGDEHDRSRSKSMTIRNIQRYS